MYRTREQDLFLGGSARYTLRLKLLRKSLQISRACGVCESGDCSRAQLEDRNCELRGECVCCPGPERQLTGGMWR